MYKRKRIHIFRRQLIDEPGLKVHAAKWCAQLEPVLAAWRDNQLTDAEMATLYLLHGLKVLYDDGWAVGPNSIPEKDFSGPWSPRSIQQAQRPTARLFQWIPIEERLKNWVPEDISFSDFLRHNSLRGVRQFAREVLMGWLNQQVPIRLMTKVPTAQEMLNMQTEGVRPVTLFLNEAELGEIVHDGRDALSFMLHDLGHARQFYSQPEHFLVHKKIYSMLNTAYRQGLLQEPECVDPLWGEKLDYLISDLNTHPIHFLSVFRATSRTVYLEQRKESEWLKWWSQLLVCWQIADGDQQFYWLFLKENDLSAAQKIVTSLNFSHQSKNGLPIAQGHIGFS